VEHFFHTGAAQHLSWPIVSHLRAIARAAIHPVSRAMHRYLQPDREIAASSQRIYPGRRTYRPLLRCAQAEWKDRPDTVAPDRPDRIDSRPNARLPSRPPASESRPAMAARGHSAVQSWHSVPRDRETKMAGH